MTKEPIKISIDSDVLNQARKTIPNISGFVEECMKQYLGIGHNLVHTSDMNKLVEQISQAQLQLYLMNERGNIEEAKQKAEKQEINLAWRRLYAEYRDTRHMSKLQLENASKVLGVSEQQLEDIVEVAFVFRDETKIDLTEWDEVYNEYGYGDE